MSESLQPPEPLPPDNSLAARLDEMRSARWAVEVASDMHRQADLLMRSFRQLERSFKQFIQPPTERN